MAESRFKKYRQILSDEAKKARAGEESKVFNAGNITAAILFIACISVWAIYFAVKPSSKSKEFSDPSKVLKIIFFDVGQGDSALLISPLRSIPDSERAFISIMVFSSSRMGRSNGRHEVKRSLSEILIFSFFIRIPLINDRDIGF